MGSQKVYIIYRSREKIYHTSETCKFVDEQPSDKIREETMSDVRTHNWWDSWNECKVCSGEASDGNTDNENDLFLKIKRIRAQKDKNKLTVEDLHS
jgi:hypothetical protein